MTFFYWQSIFVFVVSVLPTSSIFFFHISAGLCEWCKESLTEFNDNCLVYQWIVYLHASFSFNPSMEELSNTAGFQMWFLFSFFHSKVISVSRIICFLWRNLFYRFHLFLPSWPEFLIPLKYNSRLFWV